MSSPPVRPPLRDRQGGQASVELTAVLPVVVLLVALTWQVVLAGEAAWAVRAAATAAARADAVGGDAAAAAERAVAGRLRDGLRVRSEDEGVVVSVAVPSLWPRASLGRLVSRAAFPSQVAS